MKSYERWQGWPAAWIKKRSKHVPVPIIVARIGHVLDARSTDGIFPFTGTYRPAWPPSTQKRNLNICKKPSKF